MPERAPLLAWLALMLATALSWSLGANHGVAHGSTAASIIILAFLKVHLVGRYFMDLRHAPAVLSRVFDAWVLGTTAIVLGFYFLN